MVAGRPKAEIKTVQVSFRLREDEAALLRAACERLGVPPGRLLGRMIRAAFDPAPEAIDRAILSSVDQKEDSD